MSKMLREAGGHAGIEELEEKKARIEFHRNARARDDPARIENGLAR
jgi:hypothetical protein